MTDKTNNRERKHKQGTNNFTSLSPMMLHTLTAHIFISIFCKKKYDDRIKKVVTEFTSNS